MVIKVMILFYSLTINRMKPIIKDMMAVNKFMTMKVILMMAMMNDYLVWASQHSSHSGSESTLHAPKNNSSQ